MSILLFIGLSFFTVARLERKTAANVANTVRAELLGDGALAIAMSFLQHDWNNHPTVTSIDHAWRTYFNGSWAVGKRWAWTGSRVGNVGTPIASRGQGSMPGLPMVPAPADPAEHQKRLLNDLTDVLYIPRWEGDYVAPVLDAANYASPIINADYPFVYTHEFGTSPLANAMANVGGQYPRNFEDLMLAQPLFYAQQIDFWTDVDSDGDGLNDAIWIPLPIEREFSEDGIDNDLDGLIDENPSWADDGVDNDGNGLVDAFYIDVNNNGVDDAGDIPGDPNEAQPAEVATFLYTSAPGMVMLTAPLIDQRCCDGIDNNNNGQVDEAAEVTLSDQTSLVPGNINAYAPGHTYNGFDALDNDYDLVANAAPGYVFELNQVAADEIVAVAANVPSIKLWDGGTWPEAMINSWPAGVREEVQSHLKRSFTFVNPGTVTTGPNGGPLIYSFAGEPVCDIIGRMAVKITDESSKVNVNVAGALTIDDTRFFNSALGTGPMTRVLANGRSPREYETRFLPGIGPVLANRMASLTTGAPLGTALSTVDTGVPPANFDFQPNSIAYAFDVSFAGLGRVDDNGDAIWLAMDGADNDGDGMSDEGLNPLYPDYLGALEGIDDPDEFQLHKPLRNPIAETTDTIDNDGDGVTNEIGELGDNYLRTHEQIKLAEGIGPQTFEDIRNLITVHSADKNGRAQYAWARDTATGEATVTEDGIIAMIEEIDRPLWQEAGTKPHYNFATVDKIAEQIQIDWGYQPTISTGLPTGAELAVSFEPTSDYTYLRGARMQGTTLFDLHGPGAGSHTGEILGYPVSSAGFTPWFADMELQAGQLAANIVDSRDQDHARSTTTIKMRDEWWQDMQSASGVAFTDLVRRDIAYTIAGTESIRINELMVRPTRRVEAEMISAASAYAGVPGAASVNYTEFAVNAFGAGSPEFQMAHATVGNIADQVFGWDHPYDGFGVALNPAMPLGNQSAFYTDNSFVPVAGTPTTNMLEFVFLPSPGLPPGNYYLTLNTLDILQQPTVSLSGAAAELRFLIKTAAPGDTIVGDLGDPAVFPVALLDNQNNAFAPLLYTEPLTQTRVREQGNVYLARDVLAAGGDPATLPPEYFLEPGETVYTVRIPDYTSGEALHVAVWAATDGVPVSINYFEFSQEPDHEWIEIVNVEDYQLDPGFSAADTATYLLSKAVDLSGWQLRIGAGGGSEGLYQIPNGVSIAPGGSLLLGFDKYDDSTNVIGANNIALTTVAEGFGTPPFPPLDGSDVRMGPSVFDNTVDFIDRDGDGQVDAFAPDSAIISNVADSTGDPTAFGDRIVQLIPVDGTLPVATDRLAMANLVLGGGLLPNYPERDLKDNDGDDPVLTADTVDNNRNALWQADTNGDLAPDTDVVPVYGELGIDEPFEGVDEGNWNSVISPRDVSYDDVNGIYTFDDGSTQYIGQPPFAPLHPNPVPGSYSVLGTNYAFMYSNIGPMTEFWDEVAPLVGTIPPYMGTVYSDGVNAGEEPTRYEMKAFLERKFHPGDNVVVTLYVGDVTNNDVADRVTYNERDVINRSVDELLPCPYYIDVDRNGAYLSGTDGVVTLDSLYESSLWPDDTMGVDFYRSLERKHPLYHGDLHGTTNRWEATDGNYDDWAPSMSVMLDIDSDGVFESRVTELPELYAPAYQGSPLRMNYWERAREYPADLIGETPTTYASAAIVEAGDPYQRNMAVLPVDLWKYWETLPDGTRYHKLKVGVRNAPYDSLGDLLRLPNLTMVRYLDSVEPDAYPLSQERITGISILDSPAMNHPMAFQGVKTRPTTAEAYRPLDPLANPSRGLDALAVLSGVVEKPLVLTAAQAEFDAGPTTAALADELSWGPTDNRLPDGWWPVHLYGGSALGVNGLTEFAVAHGTSNAQATTYAQEHGLFDIDALLAGVPSFAAGVPTPDLDVRWGPLLSRVMYVSGNQSGFVTAPPIPGDPIVGAAGGQTLLVWRGISGLTDGKYDVYVDVGLDLGPLRRLAANSPALFTEFGGWLLEDRVPVTSRENMRIGLKFFTDTRGFRRNQPIDFARPGDFGGQSPELTNVEPYSYDVFTPDASGMIYFGEVDVRNSYLAMRLANYSNPGEVARFARVILTPAKRTEGRVNVNTTVTGPIQRPTDPDTTRIFNTLVGIPGVFLELTAQGQNVVWSDRNPNQPGKQLMRAVDIGAPSVASDFLDNTVAPVYALADHISGSRPEYADGRYFKWVPQMLGYERPIFPGLGPPVSPLSAWVDPGQQEIKYNELLERFPRLANMVTTRSDVFEIIVTVQAGFVRDENGDGMLNYRDDTEFSSLSEKKLRTVYERQ